MEFKENKMSILKLNVAFAFPPTKDGVTYLSSPDESGKDTGGIMVDPTLATLLDKAIMSIQAVEQYAIKINEGKANEEQTVKASLQISHHDDLLHLTPDEPEQEI